MKEKLIINFDGSVGSRSIPTYPLVNISIEDYIRLEFGTADTAGFFETRVTFNSIVKKQSIRLKLNAMANTVYDFNIKQRLDEGENEDSIMSEIGLLECEPVNAKFRLIIYDNK